MPIYGLKIIAALATTVFGAINAVDFFDEGWSSPFTIMLLIFALGVTWLAIIVAKTLKVVLFRYSPLGSALSACGALDEVIRDINSDFSDPLSDRGLLQ